MAEMVDAVVLGTTSFLGSSPSTPTILNGCVVERVDTKDLKSFYCGFESHRIYHNREREIA